MTAVRRSPGPAAVARAIARQVLTDYGLPESDLPPLLTAARSCKRDPDRAVRCCRRAGAKLFIATHFEWATGIAQRRARRFGHREGSDEEAEVVSEVIAYMIGKVYRFDPRATPPDGEPGGLFRGYVCRDLVTAATRHCRRLENAGCYRTRREQLHQPLQAVPLSALRAPLAAPVVEDEDELPRTAVVEYDTSID